MKSGTPDNQMFPVLEELQSRGSSLMGATTFVTMTTVMQLMAAPWLGGMAASTAAWVAVAFHVSARPQRS
jgi:hypothetical protein